MNKKRLFFISFFLCVNFIFPVTLFADPAAPVDSSSNYEKAVSFLKEDQYDSAIEFFQKALQEDHGPAEQARIYNLIGLAYLKQGVSTSSAVGSFEQAIKLDPQFAEAYFNIASAYAGNNAQTEKAAEYFQKTIEIDPHFFKAYFGLGWFTLMQKDDPAKAAEYFQKTLDQYPEFAEAYYGMGLAYIRTHKPHMALGAVSQLRGLKRDDLAAVLEQAIKDVSPPADSGTPAPAQAVRGAPATAAPQQQETARPKAHSPFEMVMKGRLTPPKKSS